MNTINNLKHTLHIDNLDIVVTRKNVKNINLSVRRGVVAVSMPYRGRLDEVEAFVKSKIDWIHQALQKTQSLTPPKTPQVIDGEQFFIWGVPYSLKIVYSDKVSIEKTEEKQIVMCVPEYATNAQRQKYH